MANNPKLFTRNSCIEVTFRTEEGLPLTASPFIRVLFEATLARAQTLYPVTICHYIVMGNHLHLILVVDYPEELPNFMKYLKVELAHAVNALLGRKKRTVWCAGYDSPRILDYEKTIQRIVYLYTNPQQANLVEAIEDYPNCSSWQAFLDGGVETVHNYIPREVIPELPRATISLKDQQKIAEHLLEAGREESSLFISPDAWMLCFIESRDIDASFLKEEIIRRVRKEEAELCNARKSPVIGAHALRLESMRKDHTPKKRGKRMICLASTKKLRIKFLTWYFEQKYAAIANYQKWKAGLAEYRPPPGMFTPGGRMLANQTPYFLPI